MGPWVGDLLEASRGVPGPPGGVLGISWDDLGAIFWGDAILIVFVDRSWRRKGCPKWGFGSQNGSKSIQKRFKIEDDV